MSAGSLYYYPNGHFEFIPNSAMFSPKAQIPQQGSSSTNIDVDSISEGGAVDSAMFDPGPSRCSKEERLAHIAVQETKLAQISY